MKLPLLLGLAVLSGPAFCQTVPPAPAPEAAQTITLHRWKPSQAIHALEWDRPNAPSSDVVAVHTDDAAGSVTFTGKIDWLIALFARHVSDLDAQEEPPRRYHVRLREVLLTPEEAEMYARLPLTAALEQIESLASSRTQKDGSGEGEAEMSARLCGLEIAENGKGRTALPDKIGITPVTGGLPRLDVTFRPLFPVVGAQETRTRRMLAGIPALLLYPPMTLRPEPEPVPEQSPTLHLIGSDGVAGRPTVSAVAIILTVTPAGRSSK